MDIQHIPRKHRNPASIDCIAAFPRGREFNRQLHLFHGGVPCALYRKLDLQGVLRAGLSSSLCGLFLWGAADVVVR